MKPYFVTGIGTGVGKTLVSAVLTEALQADYWKPIQTGAEQDSDRATVEHLVSNANSFFFKESYSFREPASPHLAAALEHSSIDEKLIRLPASKNEHLIIEGAGGLLVPLNDHFFVIDLAKHLDAEVILVCRNYLGCINHSLLSMDYLVKHNIPLKGLILNGEFDPLVRSTLLNYANIPLLCELEELPFLSRENVMRLSTHIDLNHFK